MRNMLPVFALTLLACSDASARNPSDIRCPARTERIGDAPPQGLKVYCQKRTETGENEKHGPYREWNQDGLLVLSGDFERGVQHGEWLEYHGGTETDYRWTTAKNQPKSKGKFESGKRTGPWSAWHSNGQLSLQATFLDGELDGLAREWHPNGRRASEVTFKQGARHGPRLEWFDNGSSKIEANYTQGKPDGLWTTWFRDGGLKERGTFREGTRAGHWKVWSASERLHWSGDFGPDGVAHGHWVQNTYSMIGDMSHEGEVVNGLREGSWTVRYNHNTYVATYKGGQLNGRCEVFSEGELFTAVTYRDGIVHGESITRNKNGTISRVYENGREVSCTPSSACRHTGSLLHCLPYGLPPIPKAMEPEE
jgi:antitoxin component YwqK of YwqJK toxin-antitoxin module